MKKHEFIAKVISSVRDLSIAFGGYLVPDSVSEELCSETEIPEAKLACGVFRSKSWWQIQHESLRAQYPSPMLLGPQAFSYFLPAFLVCLLEEFVFEEMSGVSFDSPLLDRLVVRLLEPRARGRRVEDEIRVELYSDDQRKVLGSVLLMLSDLAFFDEPKLKARLDSLGEMLLAF